MVHDAKVTCTFFVDIAARTISADGIRTDATVMLSKETSEISQTDHTVRLFFVGLFLLHLHILLMAKVPGMVKLTTFCAPPTMKDLDCGSSLLTEDPSTD